MTGTILPFRANARTTPDLAAAAKHLRALATTFENAEASADPDNAYTMAAHDAEAFLFHLLTHQGCREDDRELRNLLARREARRIAP